MLKETQCLKKLSDEVIKNYTPNEQEEFAWRVDEISSDEYVWNFIDHTGKTIRMTCNRSTGEVTTR